MATPYVDINNVLTELLAGMQAILGTKLVALYLYGSLVTGDFDHEVSDIDLLAATASDIDDNEFAALQTMHSDFAARHRVWDDRIEVAYLSVVALKTFRTQISKIVVISPGEPFHFKEAGKDWLMNWYVVREKGIVLFGPSTHELIAPVTKDELLQAVQEHTIAWREWVQCARARKAQAYAILTACRAFYTLRNGESVSKKRAAMWAAQELPEWSALIQSALVWRATLHDEDVDHAATLPETRSFVHAVVDLCEGYKKSR
jgi:predicted nucleotidyltransferase